MDAEKTEYRFLWLIENYSHYESRYRWLDSPEFSVEGTSWSLNLYQDLLVSPSKKDSIHLLRSAEDEGPERIGIKFEITITTIDGSTLYSRASGDTELDFARGTSRSVRAFVYKDKSRVGRNGEFFPEDTLCVLCRMWKGEDNAGQVTQFTARSSVVFEKISFLLRVANFSTLEINKANTFKTIPSLSYTGCGVSTFLETKKLKDGVEAILVEAEPSKHRHYVCRQRFWLMDASGNAIECGATRKHKEDLPKLSRKFILRNKQDYLPNDELTLRCEFLFYAREAGIVDAVYDVPMATFLAKYRDAHFKKDVESNRMEATNSGIDDLKTLSLKDRS